jgi:hypothetical protein
MTLSTESITERTNNRRRSFVVLMDIPSVVSTVTTCSTLCADITRRAYAIKDSNLGSSHNLNLSLLSKHPNITNECV